MNENLASLKPERIWHYFGEICKIPRPSKKEGQIIAYLKAFGEGQKLETLVDEAGNVLIRKPATPGKENVKTIVLQSHMDMVCEKNSDTVFNFDTDAIQPYIEDGWVKAKGTTLGADDGIGVAAQLAILEATDIPHGPIECLFTVDEETGLTGAFALKPDFLKGMTLLNLDSEDEGQLFIGCAGGKSTTISFEYSVDAVLAGASAYKISVTGLKGGHSGDEINKGLGNAVKILNRLLWTSAGKTGLRIHDINAGNLHNAIAREGFATVVIATENEVVLESFVKEYNEIVRSEFKTVDPGLMVTCQKTEIPTWVIDQRTQFNLLTSLYACAHGVIAMSPDIPGLVETSTNLASVKFKDKVILVATSQRSSIESSKHDVANMVASAFILAGAKVEHGEGYPGWKPNLDSEILKITRKTYVSLFGKEPLVLAIHAGLECGLVGETYPGMDMISFGPTLRGVHSPDEKIEIESVELFWKLLVQVLNEMK
jgi:dipeptidase D